MPRGMLADLQNPAHLVDRRLHGFEPGDFDRMVLTAGGKTEGVRPDSIARRAPRRPSRPPRRPTSAIRWPRTGTTPSGGPSPPTSWDAARSRPAASRPSCCASTTSTARARSATMELARVESSGGVSEEAGRARRRLRPHRAQRRLDEAAQRRTAGRRRPKAARRALTLGETAPARTMTLTPATGAGKNRRVKRALALLFAVAVLALALRRRARRRGQPGADGSTGGGPRSAESTGMRAADALTAHVRRAEAGGAKRRLRTRAWSRRCAATPTPPRCRICFAPRSGGSPTGTRSRSTPSPSRATSWT